VKAQLPELRPIAAEIDRLVWAVSHTVRDQHEALPVASGLPASTFTPLINLLPFRDQMTGALIQRRYIYRSEMVNTDFTTSLVDTGLFNRTDDQLTPTAALAPLVDEVNAAIDKACHHFWTGHTALVLSISQLAGAVLDEATDRHGLVAAAQALDEAPDPLHRCWQRLTALRLVRNEAHVAAWRSFDLTPVDIEFLTAARAGTNLVAPENLSSDMSRRGLVADGMVTPAGFSLRQEIEDTTDAGVETAFDAIDRRVFWERLRKLPPVD